MIADMYNLMDIKCIIDHDICITVPTSNVSVTVPNIQTVGQSLTLQCEVTTVRGITSRVDIVWSSDGTALRRINDTTATTTNNSLVYTDSYTISQLNTTDDGRVIHCEVVINISPLVMASDSITLDVTGKFDIVVVAIYIHSSNVCMPYNLSTNLLTVKQLLLSLYTV